MKTKTKTAKVTTKTASANPKRFAPIIIIGTTDQSNTPRVALMTMPTRELAELCRERGIPIAKGKPDILARLDAWMEKHKIPFKTIIG